MDGEDLAIHRKSELVENDEHDSAPEDFTETDF
jgi:hypothetical protein